MTTCTVPASPEQMLAQAVGLFNNLKSEIIHAGYMVGLRDGAVVASLALVVLYTLTQSVIGAKREQSRT